MTDSWDLEEDDLEGLGAAKGRLMNLKCVIWQDMPPSFRRHCQAAAPAVVINPSPEDITRRKLPREFDPEFDLDHDFLSGRCLGSSKGACLAANVRVAAWALPLALSGNHCLRLYTLLQVWLEQKVGRARLRVPSSMKRIL